MSNILTENALITYFMDIPYFFVISPISNFKSAIKNTIETHFWNNFVSISATVQSSNEENACYVVYGHPMKFYDYFNVKSEFYGQNYYLNSFLGRFCINFDFFPTFVWSGITVRRAVRVASKGSRNHALIAFRIVVQRFTIKHISHNWNTRLIFKKHIKNELHLTQLK